MIIDLVTNILSKYNLCNSCLGRQFAVLGIDLDNKERGYVLKSAALMMLHKYIVEGELDKVNILRNMASTGFMEAKLLYKKLFQKDVKEQGGECFICKGFMDKYILFANNLLFLKKIYEFNNFLVGCKVPADMLYREDIVRIEFKLRYGESIKREINRNLRKYLKRNFGKECNLDNPDIVFIMDLRNKGFEIQVSPVYVYGRYRKYVRGLPQTRWIKGDRSRIYKKSIEEIIGKFFLKSLDGITYKFHGGGREDIDVRTLGNGRPFVLEIVYPRKRSLDLRKIEYKVNRYARGLIEIFDLKIVDRAMVQRIKKMAEANIKTYHAIVEVDGVITDEDIKNIEKTFSNITVDQWTPLRVIKRRGNKLRKKQVYSIRAKRISDSKLELFIKCQGGLYVKELIHGDGGRTSPSVSSIIDKRIKDIELDIINIEQV